MVDGDGVRPGTIEVGIVVRDLDAVSAFYRDVLGLEYVGDLEVTVGTMKRFATGDAVLNLLHLDETPDLANPPGGPQGATGLRYLTVRIDDVASGVERCMAAGCAVPVPVFEYEPGLLIAIVEDPEGNPIELVENR